MGNILNEQKEKLELLKKEKDNIETIIEKLKQNEEVMTYINTFKKLDDIKKDYTILYKEHIVSTCKSCKHLFVVSAIEYDSWEGRQNYSIGCLKCGVDTNFYDTPKAFRTIEEEAYVSYMETYMPNCNNTGLYYSSRGEFLNGRQLYLEYREKYKDLPDEIIIEMMSKKYTKKKTII